MKSVEILLTNFNGGDTIALCIESIRKFTAYPHTIHVYDDGTWETPRPEEGMTEGYRDLEYLRAIRDKGWIRLTEGGKRKMHGACVNKLMDACTADLALIMDNDVQIVAPGWLEEMVEFQAKTDAALITTTEYFPHDDNTCINSWFVMVDMSKYPLIRDDWDYRVREDGKGDYRATGYWIYKNTLDRGLVWKPTPKSVEKKWRHYEHIAVLSAPQVGGNWAVRQQRYALIQAELRRLRASA